MTVLREENPYSRFSENRNAENFAKAIDRISNQASGSIKDFIGALDFASPSVVLQLYLKQHPIYMEINYSNI